MMLIVLHGNGLNVIPNEEEHSNVMGCVYTE